jgi:hypothetical protein
MSYEELALSYRELEVGTSYRRETMRNIFLEALPQGATSARGLLVKDLIYQKRIPDEMVALQLLHRLRLTILTKLNDLFFHPIVETQ